jgi:hypothetical protein
MLLLGREWTYWDDKVSREDMMEMWKRPGVRREWTKDGEIEGKVRFSRDSEKRPYLTTTELKVPLLLNADILVFIYSF